MDNHSVAGDSLVHRTLLQQSSATEHGGIIVLQHICWTGIYFN